MKTEKLCALNLCIGDKIHKGELYEMVIGKQLDPYSPTHVYLSVSGWVTDAALALYERGYIC